VDRQADRLTNSCISIIEDMGIEAPGDSYEGRVHKIMKGGRQCGEYWGKLLHG